MDSNTISVFHPFEQPSNFYLKEIEQHFNGSFRYGSINDVVTDIDIVHIHWPEALFGWREPTSENLQELEQIITNWRRKSKVIYTKHNEYPHFGKTERTTKLYQLIEDSADAVIHLGKYSLQNTDSFKKALNTQKGVVIPHPLYTLYPTKASRTKARAKLNLPSDANVILCLGNIRNREESMFMRKVFRHLDFKTKILVAPTMDYYLKFDIPGLSGIIKRMMSWFYRLHPQYHLKNEVVNNKDLQFYLKAANVLFIPRLNSLNSGLLLLGISFNTPVVCSNTGNNTEIIEESHSYGYDPKLYETAVQAIEKACKEPYRVAPEVFINYRHPRNIAQQYHKLYFELLNTK